MRIHVLSIIWLTDRPIYLPAHAIFFDNFKVMESMQRLYGGVNAVFLTSLY